MKASSAFLSKSSRAIALAFGFGVAASVVSAPAAAVDLLAGADPSLAIENAVQPSPLLSIDQNRSTVVDRVVSNWGDALAVSNAGLDKEQLRTLLMGLRADHLLVASLAGTLDGLRTAIAAAQKATPPNTTDKAQPKALGDSARDLVYTPVVPCRIIDTRNVGGPFAGGGGETRNYHAFLTAGTFATQGGAASNCGIPANPAAVTLNITTVGGSGFLTAWRYNTTMPLAATMIPGALISNGAIVPTCLPTCGAEFSIFTFGGHVIVDIAGYFIANQATALQCVSVASAGTLCAPNTYCNDDAPACASGYTMTGRFCNTTGIQFYMTDVREHACFGRNADTITQTLTATSRCCRVPGL